MGSLALRLAAHSPQVDVSGVVSHRSAEQARAVVAREANGLPESVVGGDRLDEVVRQCGGADVVLLATHGDLYEIADQIAEACRLGLNVICIAEHTIFPAAVDSAVAERLQREALDAGVTVVGTGANPGFLMDYLPLVLLGAARGWTRLLARRKSRLDPYGENVLKAMGIGMTPEDFETMRAETSHVGHQAFEESIGYIAAHVGLDFEVVAKSSTPVVREVETRIGELIVEPGHVVGLDERCVASLSGGQEIVLEHPQLVGHGPGEEETHDLIEVEGPVPLRLESRPAIDGGAATAGLMVNIAPAVAAAPPGLQTLASFSLSALTELRRPSPEAVAA
jgi:4-hydroxy-tetrahydrodipicolinate reductase